MSLCSIDDVRDIANTFFWKDIAAEIGAHLCLVFMNNLVYLWI